MTDNCSLVDSEPGGEPALSRPFITANWTLKDHTIVECAVRGNLRGYLARQRSYSIQRMSFVLLVYAWLFFLQQKIAHTYLIASAHLGCYNLHLGRDEARSQNVLLLIGASDGLFTRAHLEVE